MDPPGFDADLMLFGLEFGEFSDLKNRVTMGCILVTLGILFSKML